MVRGLPKLKKLFVEGNPLTLEEIRSLIKHVDTTTRTISVDIAGSVTCHMAINLSILEHNVIFE